MDKQFDACGSIAWVCQQLLDFLVSSEINELFIATIAITQKKVETHLNYKGPH